MIPNRRQFVASIAGVPLLVQTTAAQPRSPLAQAGGDPVLDEINADLRRLSAEFEAQPGSRKALMRAMESTLGIQAAHLAAHYERGVEAALRQRLSKAGRAQFVQDILTSAHHKNPALTHDGLDAALTRLQQRGVSGAVRDIQGTIRRLRNQVPDQVQAANLRHVQFDYCSDLLWMIGLMEGITTIACAIAIGEPTPGGEAVCAGLMLALGLLYLQRTFFC